MRHLRAVSQPTERAARRRRHQRERYLLPVEWLRLRAVLERQPPKVQAFFLLLLLSGARRDEARLAQWVHLDLTAGIWYKPRTKNGRSHTLALPPQAVSLLRTLPQDGPYLFWGETPAVPWSRTAVEHAWRKVRRAASLPDVQIRDLRRTCASWLAMQGVSTVTIMHVLNHSNLNVTQVYARLDQRSIQASLTQLGDTILGKEATHAPVVVAVPDPAHPDGVSVAV